MGQSQRGGRGAVRDRRCGCKPRPPKHRGLLLPVRLLPPSLRLLPPPLLHLLVIRSGGQTDQRGEVPGAGSPCHPSGGGPVPAGVGGVGTFLGRYTVSRCVRSCDGSASRHRWRAPEPGVRCSGVTATHTPVQSVFSQRVVTSAKDWVLSEVL